MYRTIEQTVLKVFDTHLSVLYRVHTLENPDPTTRTIYAWICRESKKSIFAYLRCIQKHTGSRSDNLEAADKPSLPALS